MKKTGECKLCKDKPIHFTKSDIVPKWFIKGFKDGPNGGYYVNLLRGNPGDIGERDDSYFVDDEALCKKCNNERLSVWENPTKAFYEGFVRGAAKSFEYGPWFYSFCTSISWRVLTYLQRVGERPLILERPSVADALESWRLFMMTADPTHINGHSQHIILTDPKYGEVLPGIATSFRYFDVICLTHQGDLRLFDCLEAIVREYTPFQANRVAIAKNIVCDASQSDDVFVTTFFGCFTLIGLIETKTPKKWRNCGRLGVRGGRLELSNTTNYRLLLGMLYHNMQFWSQLTKKSNDQLARAFYTTMIEPIAAILCHAAGV